MNRSFVIGDSITTARFHSQVATTLEQLDLSHRRELERCLEEAVKASRDNPPVTWLGPATAIADNCVVLEFTASPSSNTQLFVMPTRELLLVFYARIHPNGNLTLETATIDDAQNALHEMYLDFKI